MCDKPRFLLWRIAAFVFLLHIAILPPTGLAAREAATGDSAISAGTDESRLILAQAHGGPPQGQHDDNLESRYWSSIKDSNDPDDFQTYLDAFPKGAFASQARERLQKLRGKAPAKAPQEAPQPAPRQATEPARPPSAAAARDCPKCPALVLIQPGTFMMGQKGVFPFEEPVHSVTIRSPFYIGQYEVTVAEWEACVAEGGCSYSPPPQDRASDSQPITNVHWDDAQQYVAWLRKKTGKAYRLPTEAEWELAARGGGQTIYPWGDVLEKNRANCAGCNDQKNRSTVPVGSFPPNGFGLYDMVGNAAEWVEDCWNDNFKSAPGDGSAWTKPQCRERVLRGGSYNNDPRYVRSASRYKYDYDVRYEANGFRVARSP